MYIHPKILSGVYFTRNLNEGNYKTGLYLLGVYFRTSKISKAPYAPITNFDGLVGYLNKHYPSYIEALGDLSNSVGNEKLIQAMKDTAAKGYTDYPRPAYFSSAIYNNAKVSISSVVVDTAKEVGGEIVGFASLFSKIIIVAAIVGVAVFVYVETGGKMPTVKI